MRDRHGRVGSTSQHLFLQIPEVPPPAYIVPCIAEVRAGARGISAWRMYCTYTPCHVSEQTPSKVSWKLESSAKALETDSAETTHGLTLATSPNVRVDIGAAKDQYSPERQCTGHQHSHRNRQWQNARNTVLSTASALQLAGAD